MKKAVIVCRRYIPGEAWTNRMLCYAKGLVEIGFRVDVLFLITDAERNSYELPLSNINVHNLWENDCWIARKCRLISYYLNRRRISKVMQCSDVCLMFDAGGLYIKEVIRSGVVKRIYVEITEHPEVLRPPFSSPSTAVKKVVNNVALADSVLVISHSLKDFFIDHGIPSERIQVVNIFVDGDRFMNLKKTTNEKIIAYCGTVSCKKDGVDILMTAFSLFHKNHPDYRLFIYGKGENDFMIPSLKELANELGIADSVAFKGYTSYDIIPQELKNASILALARPDNKQNTNGFPTKLGEYLSTGNPVVVTAVGEIPMFIKDEINGFLAIPGDVDSFAQKLEHVANHYDEASRVGKMGAELTKKEFSYYEQVRTIFEVS